MSSAFARQRALRSRHIDKYIHGMYTSAVAPEPKTERFMIRMDASERKMLAELADMDGIPEATVVRQLVRREHAARSKERDRRKPKR